MRWSWRVAFCAAFFAALACIGGFTQEPTTQADAVITAQQRAKPVPVHPTSVLYGAAYYNEYVPSPLHPERLATDVQMMKAAGFNVVRMGESTWALWEPAEGVFDYAWMDRVVDAMSNAGIKVILGTPTYSMPAWMAKEHPEFYAQYAGGHAHYGMRQNMDYDNPLFRKYAEQLIVKIVEHYRNNPDVIGWQIDNETSSYSASNPDVFDGFVGFLKQKFGTPEVMDKAWLLNYWGQDVYDWKDMPTRDDATSTSYKLWWARYAQLRVTRYLAWQASLVRKNRRADQFVMQDFGSIMRWDVNEPDVASIEDVVADNVYHGWQDDFDGEYDAMQGALARSLKHTNYLVTETNAQTLGWDSAGQYPPYDGQLRLDAYSHYSSGSNMVEYWHWASLAAGQETYWGGVLSHDLRPNRAYGEVTRIGRELERIGPDIANLRVTNKVAILYSVDSSDALSYMPYQSSRGTSGWEPGKNDGQYAGIVQQLHRALYDANVGTDFVFPDSPDFSGYKLLIVPALYVANDALLQKIADYVRNGGNVLMTFKSGFTNENSAVRWELAPGPLRDPAGFTYQEYSNLKRALALKDDPFRAGKDNQVGVWSEFLQLTTAKPLAYYDDPFFGQWPAITRNRYGAGTLTYEGTVLSDHLQDAVMLDELRLCGLTSSDQDLPARLHAKHGINDKGRSIHYYLNYSSSALTFTYRYAAAHDLLTGHELKDGATVTLSPWDLVIAEENQIAEGQAH
jgi:beta-galactosidase